MPMLKPMAGHSTDMTAAGFYYMYNKDENGKRSPEAGVRAIAFDGINISLVSPLDPDKDWWDVMNDTRERFGNNAPHGERAARTYEHFMISPDPRDNVALDDFRQYVRQWATHFFDSKLIGRYQVAIIYHDGSDEQKKNGLPPILHAHVIVNNTEINTGRRLAPKISDKIVDQLYASVNIMALERGWHGFATNNVSMTLEEMKAVGATPSTTKFKRRDWSLDDFSDAGRYLGRDVAGNDISLHLAGDYDGVKLSPGPVSRYTLEFASGRVYEIVPQGSHTGPTMAERGLRARGEYSWKYDIRDRVDAALLVSTSVDDFISCMDRYGIDVTQNKAGQFKFCMRGEGNKAKTVLGKTLGKRYDRPSIVARLEENAATQASSPRALGIDCSRSGFAERLIDALENSGNAIAPNRTMDEFRDLMEYNYKNGIKSYEDYPTSLEGTSYALRAQLIGLFDGAPMPDTGARRIEDMTTNERAALIAKLRMDRVERGGGGRTDGHAAPVPGYGTHAGREDAPAAERARARPREQ